MYLVTGLIRITNQVQLKRLSDGATFFLKLGSDLSAMSQYQVGKVVSI